MAWCCAQGCDQLATVHVVIGDRGAMVRDASYWGMSYCSIRHLCDDHEMERNAPAIATQEPGSEAL